jgi:hypothetical protein
MVLSALGIGDGATDGPRQAVQSHLLSLAFFERVVVFWPLCHRSATKGVRRLGICINSDRQSQGKVFRPTDKLAGHLKHLSRFRIR